MTTVLTTTLLLIAKMPVAGRVKTRLCPPCTFDEAAAIASAALDDTIATLRATPCVDRFVAALDGTPDARFEGWEVVPQRGRGLDERLAAAFEDTGGGAVVLVGMDTPQIGVEHCIRAFDRLRDHDAVIGLAADGGFWLVGFADPDASVFLGVPMSSDATGAEQLARLRERYERVAVIDTMRDVDSFDDAVVVAELVPASRFAIQVALVSDRVTGVTHEPLRAPT
jgi:rSAM/selenodomain-associated transferase 1